MKTAQIVALLTLLTLMSACNTDKKKSAHNGGLKEVFKPEIIGQANEVLIVIGEAAKRDTCGGYLRYMLSDTFVGLPTDEPVFDIHTVPAGYFDQQMRRHRNLIIVNVADTVSTDTIRYFRDVWARPQAVINMSARDQASLPAIMKRHHNKIISFFHRAERERLMSYYKRINSAAHTKEIMDRYGVKLLIPNQFERCKPRNKNAMSWYMCDTKEFQDGLFVYTTPYTGEQSMSKESLIALRDSMLRANVAGPDDAPMCTETRMGLDEIDYKFGRGLHNGLDVAEVRGLWRLDGYAMGGPFVMRAIHDTIGNRIIITDGYVYYPAREHKRNHIRQLEAIMHSLSLFPQENTDDK